MRSSGNGLTYHRRDALLYPAQRNHLTDQQREQAGHQYFGFTGDCVVSRQAYVLALESIKFIANGTGVYTGDINNCLSDDIHSIPWLFLVLWGE